MSLKTAPRILSSSTQINEKSALDTTGQLRRDEDRELGAQPDVDWWSAISPNRRNSPWRHRRRRTAHLILPHLRPHRWLQARRHSPVQDKLQELLQSFLPVVHASAQVPDYLCVPALSRAVGFQSCMLPAQIGLLVVTGHSGIADCQRVRHGRLTAKQISDGIVPRSSGCFPGR